MLMKNPENWECIGRENILNETKNIINSIRHFTITNDPVHKYHQFEVGVNEMLIQVLNNRKHDF